MKYQFTYSRNDYLTPADFVKKVLKKYKLHRFDCDVCCSPLPPDKSRFETSAFNSCEMPNSSFAISHSGLRFNIPAEFFYTKNGLYDIQNSLKLSDHDGLTGSWFKNNWCNPPFNIADKFVKKALEEQKKNKNIYMLIPARTETNYWYNGILNKGKTNRKNIEIIFLKKGLCFLDPETKKPIQMRRKNKNGSYKYVDGVYKNSLALVVLKGYYG